MKLKKFNFYLPLTTLLLVILGVFLLIKADFDTKIYLFVSIGIFFLCGCLYLIAFVIDKRAHYRPGWILPAGITFLISTLFIVLSIINGTEPINSLLMASGNMTLLLGIILLASSMQYRYLEIKRWWIHTFFSLIFLVMGITVTMVKAIPDEYANVECAVIFFVIAFVTGIETVFYAKSRLPEKRSNE